MTNTPNPTWYDILGVEHDATPEQIKAAWRGATDKFEPGSGTSQFRLFNEAADVLLDPARREAYDAELAGSTTAVASEVIPDEPLPVEDAAPGTEAGDEPEPQVGPDPVTVAEPEPIAAADGPPAAPGAIDRLGARLGWVAVVWPA